MDAFNDWLITFGRVFFSPSSQTFLDESKKAKGKFPSAVAWSAFSILIVNIAAFSITENQFNPYGSLATIILLPIVVLFFVFCLHMLYLRLFNRKRNLYSEFLYLVVGIFVPATFLSTLVGFMDQLGNVLTVVIFLYSVFLIIIAVRSVTNLKMWQATVVVFLGMVLGAFGVVCLPTFLMSVMNTVPWVI